MFIPALYYLLEPRQLNQNTPDFCFMIHFVGSPDKRQWTGELSLRADSNSLTVKTTGGSVKRHGPRKQRESSVSFFLGCTVIEKCFGGIKNDFHHWKRLQKIGMSSWRVVFESGLSPNPRMGCVCMLNHDTRSKTMLTLAKIMLDITWNPESWYLFMFLSRLLSIRCHETTWKFCSKNLKLKFFIQLSF